jgi:NAD(P)-dependent dehydrogenase (short-subunit alcohol dehydrogenase family)
LAAGLAEVSIAGENVVIGRPVFTDELGWEVRLPPTANAWTVGDCILEVGEAFRMMITATPVPRARRIEAGLLNAGSDFDATTGPFAAGLGKFVEFDKGDFNGRDALIAAHFSGPAGGHSIWVATGTEGFYMKLKDKVVIITGAARGIGAALAARFAGEGAKVVVADLDADASMETASRIRGVGVRCDVTNEEEVKALVSEAEARFGSVDMFCSNAGVCLGEPDHAASASNETWQTCWDVHVMSHVYAARAVLPGMINRGDGYLLQMASAAGLLSQIGDAAYSATKHAAVGFAESLSISHGRDGIKVSVICPQYVATAMLGYSDASEADKLPGVMTPQDLADTVVKGVEEEAFLILPHPDVAQFIQFKSANYDKWLGGMRKLRGKIINEIGTTDVTAMHKLV